MADEGAVAAPEAPEVAAVPQSTTPVVASAPAGRETLTVGQLYAGTLGALRDMAYKPEGDPQQVRARQAVGEALTMLDRLALDPRADVQREAGQAAARVRGSVQEHIQLQAEKSSQTFAGLLAQRNAQGQPPQPPAATLFKSDWLGNRGLPTRVTSESGAFQQEPSDAWFVPRGTADRAVYENSPAIRERMMILNAPIEERGMRRYVGDVEIPHIDEAAKDRIRQFTQGFKPGTGGTVATNDWLFDHVLHPFMATDGTPPPGQWPSASGTMPGPVPFTKDDNWNLSAMQDPAWMRAYAETVKELAAEGNLSGKWYEYAGQAGRFAVETALFSKGLGAAGEAAAGALRAADTAERLPGIAWTLQTMDRAAATAKQSRALGVITPGLRTTLELSLYQGLHNTITKESDFWHGAGQGLGTGVELAVLGPIASIAFRRLPLAIASWLKADGGLRATIADAMAKNPVAAGQSLIEREGAAWLERSLAGGSQPIIDALTKAIASPSVVRNAVHVWDASALGLLYGGTAYASQQLGRSYQQGLWQEPWKTGKLIMEGMLSQHGLGNALGFGAAAAGLQGRAGLDPAIAARDPQAKAAAESVLKDWVWGWTHPTDPSEVARAAAIFEPLKRERPDLFHDWEVAQRASITPEPTPSKEPVARENPPVKFGPEQESPSGRSWERVQEMYSHWTAAMPVKRAGEIAFDPVPATGAKAWVDRSQRIAVVQDKRGTFQIVHAQGELSGRRLGRTGKHDTLEDAIAQGTRVAQKKGYIPPYTTPEPGEPLFTTAPAMTAEEQKANLDAAMQATKSIRDRQEQDRRIFEAQRDQPETVGQTPGDVVDKAVQQKMGRTPAQQAAAVRASERMRALLAKRRANPESAPGAREFARMLGGINPDDPVETNLYDQFRRFNRTPGELGAKGVPPGENRYVVHKPGSGKGMKLYALHEAMDELGWFGTKTRAPGEAGSFISGRGNPIDEVLDALRRDTPNPMQSSVLAEEARKTEEQRQEGVAREQLEEAVHQVAMGVHEVPGGQASVESMASETHTPKTRLMQAKANADRVREILVEAGVLDPAEPMHSTSYAVMLRKLANADPELVTALQEQIDTDAASDKPSVAEAIQRARNVSAYTQAAFLKWSDVRGKGEAARAYLQALDDMGRLGQLTDATKNGLKKFGWLTEQGGMHESLPGAMAKVLGKVLEDSAGEHELNLFAGINPRYALWPTWLGKLLGNPGVEGGESVLVAIPNAIKRAVQAIGEIKNDRLESRALRAINQAWTQGLGRPGLAAGSPDWLRARHERLFEDLLLPASRERGHFAYEAQLFEGAARTDFGRIPPEFTNTIGKLVNDGAFKDGRINGPDDLAKYVPPWYADQLYRSTDRAIGVLNELGERSVETGYLSKAQVDALRDQYFTRRFLNTDEKTVADMFNAGRYTEVFLPRRDMGRSTDAGAKSVLRVWDPWLTMPNAIRQEARANELFRWLNAIASSDYSVASGEAAQAPPHERGWLERTAVDPSTITQGERDPITGRKYSIRAQKLGRVLVKWRAEMQTPEEADAGILPTGKHPYTPAKARMIEALLPSDGSPGRYTDRVTAAMQGSILEGAFYTPDPSRAARWLENISRAFRGNVTIRRPLHNFNNNWSSILGNYQSGGVTPWDWISSITTGQGHYADTWRRLIGWEKWAKAGKPRDAETLTKLGLDKHMANGWLDEADEVIGRLSQGTFHSTLIETGIIGDLLGPTMDDAALRMSIREQLKESMRQKDSLFAEPTEVDESLVDQLAKAQGELYKRHMSSISKIDAAMVDAFSQESQQQRVAGIQQWQAQYQLQEVSFGYANALYWMSKNPGMTIGEGLRIGKAATADYMRTSPVLRWWTTSFKLGSDPLIRGADPNAVAKGWARFLFAQPFMLWGSSTTPTYLRSAFAYPLRFAVTAGITAAVAGLITTAVRSNLPQLREAMAGGQGYSAVGLPSAQDWKDWEARYGDRAASFPGAYEPTLDPRTRLAYPKLLAALGSSTPFVTSTLGRGMSTRMQDLAPIAAGPGWVAGNARTALGWGDMNNVEKAKAIVRGLVGWGPQATSGVSSFLWDMLYNATEAGDGSKMVRAVERVQDSIMPALSPGWVLSPQARRMAEIAETDDMPMDQWVQGRLDPFASLRSKGPMLAGLVAENAIGGRVIPTWGDNQGAEDVGLLRALATELVPGFERDLKPDQQLQAMEVAKAVRDQVADLVHSAYSLHSEANGLQLDSIIKSEIDTFRNQLERQGDRWSVRQGAEGGLARFILSRPEDTRTDTTEAMLNFLRSKAFTAQGMPTILELGRERRADPDFARRLFTSAVHGPDGVALLSAMHGDLIEKSDAEHAPEWYDLFTQMPKPQGGTPLEQWREVRSYFERIASGDLLMPQEESARKALGSRAPDVVPQQYVRQRQ